MRRIAAVNGREDRLRAQGHYLLLQTLEATDGNEVVVGGRRMLQFASYSYLDLLRHPKIQDAAQAALEKYGSGTHGVRLLAGTTPVHVELEETIARFKGTESAIAMSSGYAANSSTIAALTGRGDVVICDKLNHASIVDGCLLSRASFVRYEHNNMAALQRALRDAPRSSAKLVVTDAVFSMDGDIVDLPEVIQLCRRYDALLMVDEAHSIGVLGSTGRGIEEHFGIDDGGIDIRMGTLSKTIPSIGGYIAGDEQLIRYLRHASRAFFFSAALPPPSAAAATAAFNVIEAEPERVARLQANVRFMIERLQQRGFNTLDSASPIIPIIVGDDDRACAFAKQSQERGIFVLPVLTPAVQAGASRLRVTVTAGHTETTMMRAVDIFEEVGRDVGLLRHGSAKLVMASLISNPHTTPMVNPTSTSDT
jgi:glycine C-acetyltransferase